MAYIGKKPTDVPLSTSDLNDDIITQAKMADDAIALAELKAGTDGELITIVLRDHEYPDGDIIEVLVNDKIVLPAILLSEKAVGFKLDLKAGFNVIDFVALNQGSSGPNTAEVRVYDDIGNLVGYNRWNLATGVKATYIVYKN